MITLNIPEIASAGALKTPLPVTVNNDRYMLVDEQRYHEMEAAMKNIKALEEIKKERIARKIKLAESLFGILPSDISFEEVMEERLSKI